MRKLALSPAFAFLVAPASFAADADLQHEVREILTQHCYECHGPDSSKRRAKLRFDRRAEAFGEREDGIAIVPGHPGDSLLIERIFSEDDPMPPEGKGKPLSPEQQEKLRVWIADGAPWPEHWSFVPPQRPEVPAVEDAEWVRDPIDAFVLARLQSEDLSPATESTREAWLRRVSFDLTGLPPTPKELDVFLGDHRDDAFARQVDRLLASPRYGERQAQDWLDVARYADTNGNQFDQPRSIWKWRDWVIDAYNENMAYDRFTVEQLAGDLLPEPTLSQLVATGFNRNHPTDTDNPAEPNEYRSEYVIDRVHTTATTFMGLTMACAQCHDHKYDPVSQEDFYSLYAFFNNIDELDVDNGNPRPKIRVPNEDQEPLLKDLTARIGDLEKILESDDPVLDRAQNAWENEVRAGFGDPIAWEVLEPSGMLSKNGAWLDRQEDGSIRSTGPAPVKDVIELVFRPGVRKIQALRLEVLPDPEAPQGSTGRAQDGRFNLSGLEIRHSSISEARTPPLVYIAKAEADLKQKRIEDADEWVSQPGDIASAIVLQSGDEGGNGGGDFGRSRGGWSLIGEARQQAHEAVFLPLSPLDLNQASVLQITMRQDGSRPYKSLLARFRWSVTDDDRVRHQLLPTSAKLWSTLGPFPAADTALAYSTRFDPEKDLVDGLDLLKRYEPPKPPAPKKESKGGKPGQGGKGGGEKAAPSAAKKGGEKGEAGKPGEKEKGKPDAKPAEAVAKAEDAPKPDAREEAKDDEEDEAPPEASFGRRRSQKITWSEQRGWRDGDRQRLSGDGAFYLRREVVCDRATTAVLRLDGPAGVKVWLNGEPAYSVAPEPPAPEKKKEDSQDQPGQGEDEENDFEGFDFGRFRRDEPGRTVRLGFRKGSNELVVKAVFAKPASSRRGSSGGGGQGFSRGRSSGNSITFDFTPEADGALAWDLERVLREDCERAPDDAKRVREHFRTKVSTIGRALSTELARLEKERRDVERKLPETMIMRELEAPRTTHVLVRGDFRRRGKEVTARTPVALPPIPDGLPNNRLGLAKWLVSGDHPLTARVAVNRMWQQIFGAGLVGTAEDFGIRGALPTHPALLDRLAVDFVEGGWDVKAMLRRLVLSATYRQDSTATAEKLEKDPTNALLSRGARGRLSAEMVRDNALSVSGLLVEKVGGPSVKPYQAAGLWSDVTGGRDWRKDKGEAQYRRGVYVYRKRRVPYASMSTFDGASGESCLVSRPLTTTPLQALVLLNNPVYVESARALAQRLLGERIDSDEGRLAFGFRLCTSRQPHPEELAVLTRLLSEQTTAYEKDEASAKKLMKIGDLPADEKTDVRKLAAWTAVSSALLNLDATIHEG